MAATAAAKQMLLRLGLSDEAATEITSATGQNLSDVADFAELGTSEIKMLFSSLKQPGGLTAAGNRNYGIPVNMISQTNFRAMCFLCRHITNRQDRVLTAGDIVLPKVKKARAMQVMEENHSDPSVLPVYDIKNWPKTMELVVQYIEGFRAQDGSRMSYILRQNLFAPPAADDPSYGTAGSVYGSPDEEIIARHRIVDQSVATASLEVHEKSGPFTDEYLFDRGKVFDLLTVVFASLAGALTIMKPFKKSRDGRGSWLALWNHYLGPNNVDNMATRAERVLSTSVYHGQSSRYGIEQHILVHKAAHATLESLTDYGYTGIDSRSKVRYLNDSIKTTKLDAPKSQIMASAELRNDFDGCATLYKDFVAQSNMNDHNPKGERQISALTGDKVRGGYVPDAEWRAMSQEEKAAELKAREDRKKAAAGNGKKRGGGNKNDPRGVGTKLSKYKKAAATWSKKEYKVAKAAVKALKEEGSDDEETVPMKDEKDAHGMRQKSDKKRA